MLQHMISLLFLFLPFSLANPKPTPTLPFTVAAFQSPFPPTASNSVTGLRISASDGFFLGRQNYGRSKDRLWEIERE
jgi:hypothetical protein